MDKIISDNYGTSSEIKGNTTSRQPLRTPAICSLYQVHLWYFYWLSLLTICWRPEGLQSCWRVIPKSNQLSSNSLSLSCDSSPIFLKLPKKVSSLILVSIKVLFIIIQTFNIQRHTHSDTKQLNNRGTHVVKWYQKSICWMRY